MEMPDRKYLALNGYRYGFNGKENDNEVKGEGNQQDYGMRIYDPRLGRFLSVDPLARKYSGLSPYAFAMNRPVDGIDIDGLEWLSSGKYPNYITGKWEVKYKVTLSLNNAKNVLQLTNTTEKERLEGIAKKVEEIFNTQSYKGTIDDPVVKVAINFTNETGTFKMAFTDQTFVNNLDAKTGIIKADVPYNGVTETMGDIENNKIEVGISQTFLIQTNGKTISRTTSVKSNNEIARTVAHELGHTLGLRHPFDPKADEGDVRNDDLGPVIRPKEIVPQNLMNTEGNRNYPSNSGTTLEENQRKKIDKKLSNATKIR